MFGDAQGSGKEPQMQVRYDMQGRAFGAYIAHNLHQKARLDAVPTAPRRCGRPKKNEVLIILGW